MRNSWIPSLFLAVLSLFGCATDKSADALAAKAQPTTETISVFRGSGAVQCTGGGVTLASNERRLSASGVRVLSASCGTTGRMYPSVCGGASGDIHIFEIPASQKDAAAELDFAPLSNLPGSRRVDCK